MTHPQQLTRRRLCVAASTLAFGSITSTTASARPRTRTIDFTADVPSDNSESGGSDDGSGSDTSVDCRDDGGKQVDLFVAVVDRIVDGEHVVFLLEDGDELVDQHVEPVGSFESVAEGDILFVALDGDDLLGYRHLEERPQVG